jgi:hypothetical protein
MAYLTGALTRGSGSTTQSPGASVTVARLAGALIHDDLR